LIEWELTSPCYEFMIVGVRTISQVLISIHVHK